MVWDADIAAVGSLLAEAARCRILFALADGRALAATTLAAEAGIAPSTASGHLGRLLDAGWISVETHSRHRFYRLDREEVGEVIEAAARLAPAAPAHSLAGDLRRRQIRRARTCYGHLAGRLGVAVTDALIASAWIDGHDGSFRPGSDRLSAASGDVAYRLTAEGSAGLHRLGAGGAARAGAGVRHCVDWSEQRHHVAGAVGAALARRLFDLDWLTRAPKGRAVTEPGAVGLVETFGIDIDGLDDLT